MAQHLAPDASREEGIAGAVRDVDAAAAAAAHYQDIFGKDNFFIEIQDHGLEPQRRILPDLVDISRRIGAPLLAANDAHYTRRDEAETHDVLLCIQTGATRDEPNRFRFDAKEFYLKSAAEMRRIFPTDQYPGACDNTLLVAERATVDLEFGRILLPQFTVPAGKTEASYLRELVMGGAVQRYGDPLPEEVTSRIDHELSVIEDMGFPAYFLIVWDLISHAREKGIRTGPGRGSAAASIVSYCLRITDLDPLRYGLVFERFLNPGRRQLPDIDMDFDERYRGDVIRYAAEKYGSDHVAQIVTFSTIKGKQALRDAARVLGYPYGVGDRAAKLMPPPILGRDAALGMCLDALPDDADGNTKDWHANASGLREAYATDPDIRSVADVARNLEGLRRQDSIHAAAVVISPVPLTEHIPIQQKGDGAEVVTQYEMHAIEDLGLLKMDFLGLRNLSIMERTLELIDASSAADGGPAGEPNVDIDNVPLDDPPTFELLRSAQTIGVFQLEGSAMRGLIRNLAPDRFEDVIALVALYRPGPMRAGMHTLYADRKNGRAPVEVLHPDMAPILERSYGIMVYQEQVLQVAQVMAGYSMAEAENLRRAMGKKIPAVMRAEEEKFVAGCTARGHSEALGKQLFALIEHFAGYGFNLAHAACYGLIAYQTAWLKAHYPAEYMAAMLTATKKDKERTAVYLNECRAMGVQVLTPDVNTSQMDFSVYEGAIRFGLSAVRNVGEGVVERIVDERSAGEPFAHFQDFIDRVDPMVLNKRTIESLIKAGAFDGLGHSRRSLILVYEQWLEATLVRRRNEEMGQYTLFGGGSQEVEEVVLDLPEGEWDQKVKLAFEREMLGLYISDHPLLGVATSLRRASSSGVPELWEQPDGASVTIGGMVGAINRRFTRNGEAMLFFQCEDLEGSVEVVAFPKVAADALGVIREGAIVVVSGRLDHRGDDIKVVAREIKELEVRGADEVRLEVSAAALSPRAVGRLKEILGNHPGTSPVFLHMVGNGNHKVLKLGDEHRVEPRSALYAELRELFGSGAIV